MKKQSKAQKFNDLANAIGQIRKGEPVKRIGAKDGSIRTHSVIGVPDVLEKIVLQDCLKWLREKEIICNRNNTGAGEMGTSGFYNYGIKNGGDIIGISPHGQHLEFECKRGKGGRLSIGQQKRMKQILENGGIYLIIHGKEELEYYLTKTCSKCKEKRLIFEFYKHKFTKDKLHSWCKNCIKNATQNWRKTINGHLHIIFHSMKQRCTDENFSGYKYWGGKGIKVLFDDVEEFIDYVINELQIDPRSLEIHRVNNNSHYEPGNIQFLTKIKHRQIH